jgi:hypothetical protein
MKALPYDILKKDSTALVWVEAVKDLETARTRIKELVAGTDGEYVVFDQRTGKIVMHCGISGQSLGLV